MNAIVAEEKQNRVKEPKGQRWNLWPRWAVLAGVSVALVVAVAMLPSGLGFLQPPGARLLAQSVKAMSNIQTVHMVGRMRTLPCDNFELIGANYDFVPIELWREFGAPSRWRVEKTGRVVVMDGQSSTLYISMHFEAMKSSPNAGFVEWLKPLLDPEQILQSELDAARKGNSEISESESGGTITLTVHQKAKGDFTDPWAMNKSILESDHTCVYTFDAESKRLKALHVSVNQNGNSTEVLDITDIRYDETMPPALFTLNLPSDVIWLQEPSEMKAASATFTGPRDVAEFFFKALAGRNWDSVLDVFPASSVSESIKEEYGGLQIISIGQPSKSGIYPGYFVPYEIRLPIGEVKKHRLAVRNDNPAHRWYVDGGF